jgi:hypothetical protein
VLVEEIYGVDLQPLKRPFCDLFDMLWPTIESVPLASVVGVGFPSELRRDRDFPAKRSELRLPSSLTWAVCLGSMKNVTPFHSGVPKAHLCLF